MASKIVVAVFAVIITRNPNDGTIGSAYHTTFQDLFVMKIRMFCSIPGKGMRG